MGTTQECHVIFEQMQEAIQHKTAVERPPASHYTSETNKVH